MFWLWLALGIVAGTALLLAGGLVALYFDVKSRYLDFILRIFLEKPLFVIPRGQPVESAEDVRLTTETGLTLQACYLRTPVCERKGVILFGLEYGSNRWSAVSYCQFLLDAGYDIFACEPRGQGESDAEPGYEPTQWVTDYEIEDMRTALAYLSSRPDADPKGVGLFGLSKGGSAGLLAASRDPSVRCFVTDGIFATRATMVPYMQKWVALVSTRAWLFKILPVWFYALICEASLSLMRHRTGRRYPRLEDAMRRLRGRPLLMIHGEGDTYIKPEMAKVLYERARQPKELWMVPKAKHNQAIHVARDEYQARVLRHFDRHLASADRDHFRVKATGIGQSAARDRKRQPEAALAE